MTEFIISSDLCIKLFEETRFNNQGDLANYIPELAQVDPALFSFSYCDVFGREFHLGDREAEFSLQSTSKPFIYSLALEILGIDKVHSYVGVEPTGEAFNSIIELEEKSHRPFNPMINSGAIATTSLVLMDSILRNETSSESLEKILVFLSSLAGKKLFVNDKIYFSERSTAHRNRAIAYLMKHFGTMNTEVEPTLDLYFSQCSVMVNTQDLARMAVCLANRGVSFDGKRILASENVQKTLGLMLSCGMYDTSGEWIFKVGLPAKSGVSGAIFVVVPGQFAFSIYSPKIDEHGHSVRGKLFIENLVKNLKLSLF